jgi:hypothetical protein
MTQRVVSGAIHSLAVWPTVLSPANPRVLVRAVLTIWLTGVALEAAGCGPPPPLEDPVDVAPLPEFTPSEALLFDDTISQAVSAADLEEVPPAGDRKLAERIALADSVVPVKVSTVISDSGAMAHIFQLVVVPNGPPFAGASVEEPMTLVVSRLSPAYPLVRSEGESLVGRALIIFFRRYQVDGDVQIHWRIDVDSKRMRKAISRARTRVRTGS